MEPGATRNLMNQTSQNCSTGQTHSIGLLFVLWMLSSVFFLDSIKISRARNKINGYVHAN